MTRDTRPVLPRLKTIKENTYIIANNFLRKLQEGSKNLQLVGG